MYVIIIAILLLVIYLIAMYNSFVRLRELVRNAKSQIAAAMKSRWDALTNIMEAAKKYEAHESDVLIKISENRLKPDKNSSAEEFKEAQNSYEKVYNRLFAIAEAYPELKASQVFTESMSYIDEYEKSVRSGRMMYNDVVTRYNRTLKVFPNVIFSSMFGFKEEGYFEGSSSKSDAPRW